MSITFKSDPKSDECRDPNLVHETSLHLTMVARCSLWPCSGVCSSPSPIEFPGLMSFPQRRNGMLKTGFVAVGVAAVTYTRIK